MSTNRSSAGHPEYFTGYRDVALSRSASGVLTSTSTPTAGRKPSTAQRSTAPGDGLVVVWEDPGNEPGPPISRLAEGMLTGMALEGVTATNLAYQQSKPATACRISLRSRASRSARQSAPADPATERHAVA